MSRLALRSLSSPARTRVTGAIPAGNPLTLGRGTYSPGIGLSSVALPHYEMGRLATDLLIKEERHRSVHLVDMLLRHRDSIGPPAR